MEERGRSGARAATGPAPARRLTGVDAARGLALIGMVAVHTLSLWNDETGRATLAGLLFSGKASALFVTLAGVGLALGSGRRTPRRGRELAAARASLAARAAVLALVGLLTGYPEPPANNILVYYAAYFLLALPLLGLRARALLPLCVLLLVAGPLLRWWLMSSWSLAEDSTDPHLLLLLTDPATVLLQVLLTGVYPALPWLAYLCAGLALGRTDLSQRPVQIRLVAGGAVLALGSWGASMLGLHVLGGEQAVLRAAPWLTAEELDAVVAVGRGAAVPDDPWWLVVPGPHTTTPFALALCLGTALCALGLVLLLARVAARALAPLAALGSMTLTLYACHLTVLGLGAHEAAPAGWFWAQVAAALLLAVAWRRHVGPGPLEHLAALAARAAGRRVLARGAPADRS
ncbi:heparan-alpha-glucosaminide N-acetyltransferase domain-containing protein [Kocuria rosea]|uniref:heparan-alpha-glucosaminide N-acetyltransferase domain-containing protein n=1 Tax=Kocuria rosea TaxID=1275 RepID=UPI0020403B32|nr:heparan-alpha-glucosaminide N-acetyltransferase domain-containing protein [Kocuria rosea]MCM3687864.1 DUF1624 domain-containing protein [Kocuria rosea]